MTRRTIHTRAGKISPISLLVLFLLTAAAALAMVGWGRAGHETIVAQALRELPPPLATWAAPREFEIWQASTGPDERTDQLKKAWIELKEKRDALAPAGSAASSPVAPPASAIPAAGQAPSPDDPVQAAELAYRAARVTHYFDIDAMTDEAAPYAAFPRDEKAAALQAAAFVARTDRPQAAKLLGMKEADLPAQLSTDQAEKLGAAIFAGHGRLPWAIRDAQRKLVQVFKDQRMNDLPSAIGELAHYVGDLHQPLHTTKNFDGPKGPDGQPGPAAGVHMAFEINMINRHPEYYLAAPASYFKPYDFIADPAEMVFQQMGANALLASKVLAADRAARAESGARPEDFAWLKAQSNELVDAVFAPADPAAAAAARKPPAAVTASSALTASSAIAASSATTASSAAVVSSTATASSASAVPSATTASTTPSVSAASAASAARVTEILPLPPPPMPAGSEQIRGRLVRHADALHQHISTRDDDLARRQLAAASSTLASLIYTAWVEAGKPPLEPPPAPTAPPAQSLLRTLVPAMLAVLVVMLIFSRRRTLPPAPPQ